MTIPRHITEFLDSRQIPYLHGTHPKQFTAGTHTDTLQKNLADVERIVHPNVGKFAWPLRWSETGVGAGHTPEIARETSVRVLDLPEGSGKLEGREESRKAA